MEVVQPTEGSLFYTIRLHAPHLDAEYALADAEEDGTQVVYADDWGNADECGVYPLEWYTSGELSPIERYIQAALCLVADSPRQADWTVTANQVDDDVLGPYGPMTKPEADSLARQLAQRDFIGRVVVARLLSPPDPEEV